MERNVSQTVQEHANDVIMQHDETSHERPAILSLNGRINFL
jgi:hypothetical protein